MPWNRKLSSWEIAARRRNALKSTGPRTSAGRRRSSLNSLKLPTGGRWRAGALAVKGSYPPEFRRLRRDLIAALDPVWPIRPNLLEDLVLAWWSKAVALWGWEPFLARGFQRESDDERIEVQLARLVIEVRIGRRKWFHRLVEICGGSAPSSYQDLRTAIEARLTAIREAPVGGGTTELTDDDSPGAISPDGGDRPGIRSGQRRRARRCESQGIP